MRKCVRYWGSAASPKVAKWALWEASATLQSSRRLVLGPDTAFAGMSIRPGRTVEKLNTGFRLPDPDFGPVDLRMPSSRPSWASRRSEREALAPRDLFWNADFKFLFQIGKAPNRVNDVNGHLELPMRVLR